MRCLSRIVLLGCVVAAVLPTAAQIKPQLLSQLTPSVKSAKITALLKNGGYTLLFKALVRGRVVIGWYYPPARSAAHQRQKQSRCSSPPAAPASPKPVNPTSRSSSPWPARPCSTDPRLCA